MTNLKYLFLYTSLINRALSCHKSIKNFNNSINIYDNLEVLAGYDTRKFYADLLEPCSDCNKCEFNANLFMDTDINNICIVNAILIYAGLKTDVL